MPFPFPVINTARATVTTSTATEIVAAVAGQRIHVLGYSIQSQGVNTPTFYFADSSGSPVTLSRTWLLDATGAAGPAGVVQAPNELGCGVNPTTTGKALNGKMDTTGTVVVEVSYVLVD